MLGKLQKIPLDGRKVAGFDRMIMDFEDLSSWENALKGLFSSKYQGVIVAHSGGVDSTALFDILWRVSKQKFFFPLAVGHVNFGLRGKDSDLDERFSQAMAERAGVPFKCLKVGELEKRQKTGKSTQEWAREIRRAAFTGWAAEDGGWIVALAHHEGDLAENVLLRLARGSSSGTLLGMKEWDPPFWRPLLREKKSRLAAHLAATGLSHREDASNGRMDYDRNVIRHEILPKLEALYPGATERIIACAAEAGELARFARNSVGPDGRLGAGARRRLSGLPDVVAADALAAAMPSWREGRPRPLTRRWLTEAVAAIKEGSKRYVSEVPGGDLVLVVDGEEVRLEPSLAAGDGETKPPRAAQHRRSLGPPLWEAFIEPGATASMRVGEHAPSLVAGEAQGVQSNLGPEGHES